MFSISTFFFSNVAPCCLSVMFLNLLSLLHFTSPFLSFTNRFPCLPFSPSPPPSHILCPFHTFVLHLPLAAVAGGGTTARRATATGGTNTRRARGARRAKRPAGRSVQTKRTRRPWSSDHHLLFFLSLSICPSVSPTKTRKKEKGEDEH